MKSLIILVLFLTFHLLSFELKAQTIEIDSLEDLLQKHLKKDTIRVNLLIETAIELYLIDIDKTLKYATEAGEIADKLSFKKGIAESLRLIGLYYDEKLDYVKALEYYQKALKISEEIGKECRISKCYNNIGIIYRIQGDYPKALEYYQKSLKIDMELDDKKGMSYCYNNIGIIYFYQHDYPKALKYYQKSLRIKEELSDKRGMSYCYNNIGIIYEFQNDYPRALEYYQKSLRIKEELTEKEGISVCLNNIGTIYKYQNNYPKAFECYRKSLKISIEIGNKPTEAYSYIGLASLYLEQNKTKEAYNFSKKAYALAHEIGNAELKKESSEILAKSSYALGLYKEAYKYHDVFKTMNDSLFNEKNIKKITGLEYQYKYEKEKQVAKLEQQRINEIREEEKKREKIVRYSFVAGFILMSLLVLVVFRSLLQKRKANRKLAMQKERIEEKNAQLFILNKEIQAKSNEVKATNHELSLSNATKDKFFSIIAHDLRSPFSALLGFSEILLEEHKEYDDKKREDMIKIINNSAERAFKLLENLLTWSLSQSRKIKFSPEKLHLKALLHETMIDLQEVANKKNIQISVNISESELIYADKNMYATVFRNIISNAIKFTNTGGNIVISSEKQTDNKFIKISVADNGVGIPKGKINDLFRIDKNPSTQGTEKEKGTGLGLILCKEFIENHKGKIWVESKEGKGSTFIFTIPKVGIDY